MFESLFDIPLLISGPAIILVLCLFALTGMMVVRRRVLPRLRVDEGNSDFTGAMLQSIMVFYGLAVALIAVSVWQTYSDTSGIVSQEATALATLYRDVSSYPEPARPMLQNGLRDYVQSTITEAWPQQHIGRVPKNGVELMNRFQATLFAFEPATESQKLLHAETLRAYNEMIKARRLRLDAVGAGLPKVMWTVIVLGAFIGLSASFFFRVEDPRLQGIQVLLLAIFIGLIIFMILALDRPFRGDLGIGPEPYQLIYDQLMKP
ncbi:MAG TPA: hypothetical protein VGN86_07640 [Pyrinomonadaceae bacterium]|nr:hypothetical protein [Pyrinomonadaceae bacterium]